MTIDVDASVSALVSGDSVASWGRYSGVADDEAASPWGRHGGITAADEVTVGTLITLFHAPPFATLESIACNVNGEGSEDTRDRRMGAWDKVCVLQAPGSHMNPPSLAELLEGMHGLACIVSGPSWENRVMRRGCGCPAWASSSFLTAASV